MKIPKVEILGISLALIGSVLAEIFSASALGPAGIVLVVVGASLIVISVYRRTGIHSVIFGSRSAPGAKIVVRTFLLGVVLSVLALVLIGIQILFGVSAIMTVIVLFSAVSGSLLAVISAIAASLIVYKSRYSRR